MDSRLTRQHRLVRWQRTENENQASIDLYVSHASPQFCLFPTRGGDEATMQGAAQLVASGGFELAQRVGAEVDQHMALEPSPQILHWVELGTVARQQGHLDRAVGAVEVD